MKTIIFDVMGNDNGVEAGVTAANHFVKQNIDYKILLVGDKKQILKYTVETEKIEIYDNPLVVDKNSGDLLSSYKEENSMNTALKLLKENRGQAVLSSGDSGKYLSSATMIIKRLPNVGRPAFMSIIPTIIENKKFLLLDEGANLNVTSDYLIQWSKLAAIFSNAILKVKKPAVGIVNIGTEDNKGFKYHQEANEYLIKTKSNNFNYCGFIESRDLLDGKVDIAIADGYAGNMILKSLEGAVLSLTKLIKFKITKNIWRKIGAIILKKSFNEVKEHLDYRNVGAAWIIGLNGIIIKAHGGSDYKAYLGALNQIKLGIESNAISKLRQALAE